MTAKDKANELIHKYYKLIQEHKYHYVNQTAIDCAIIAVDEIIECTGNGLGTTKFSKEYWQEVKQELQNLK